jgi:hypothetical protein
MVLLLLAGALGGLPAPRIRDVTDVLVAMLQVWEITHAMAAPCPILQHSMSCFGSPCQ